MSTDSMNNSTKFSFQDLSDPIVKAVEKLGYEQPTDIQSKAIPLLLDSDGDFVGQAQTGTGKTAAFGIPLLEKLNPKRRGIQAVVLSPTRELANQIDQEIKKFSKYTNFKTTTVYGGVGYKDQIRGLRDADIVIATPGRAIDLLNRGQLALNKVNYFIIDEADEMLKMGFIEDVEILMDQVSDNVQTWMFSATMPPQIIRLIEQKLNSPEIIRTKNKTLSNESVHQMYCEIQRKDFSKALRAVLMSEKDFYGIVFCETREETKNLADKLFNLGKRVVSLHGELSQAQRDKAVEQFKNRKAEILVCTDVAARGLDISEVTHVINMGLPRKHDSYVHRVGRTGRAGQTGKAISFIDPREFRNLRMIEQLTRQKIDRFKLPKALDTKRIKIAHELDKMDGIKEAITTKGKDFAIDDSYELFQEYFQAFSKEEVSKILFSHFYKKDLRSIDESLESLERSIKEKPKKVHGRRISNGSRRPDRERRRFRDGGRRSNSEGRRRSSRH